MSDKSTLDQVLTVLEGEGQSPVPMDQLEVDLIHDLGVALLSCVEDVQIASPTTEDPYSWRYTDDSLNNKNRCAWLWCAQRLLLKAEDQNLIDSLKRHTEPHTRHTIAAILDLFSSARFDTKVCESKGIQSVSAPVPTVPFTAALFPPPAYHSALSPRDYDPAPLNPTEPNPFYENQGAGARVACVDTGTPAEWIEIRGTGRTTANILDAIAYIVNYSAVLFAHASILIEGDEELKIFHSLTAAMEENTYVEFNSSKLLLNVTRDYTPLFEDHRMKFENRPPILHPMLDWWNVCSSEDPSEGE